MVSGRISDCAGVGRLAWYTLADYRWYTLADYYWYIIARLLTPPATSRSNGALRKVAGDCQRSAASRRRPLSG